MENSHAKPEMHFQIAREGLSGGEVGFREISSLNQTKHRNCRSRVPHYKHLMIWMLQLDFLGNFLRIKHGQESAKQSVKQVSFDLYFGGPFRKTFVPLDCLIIP